MPKFFRLSWPDRGTLFFALFLLPLVSVLLRVFGFSRCRRWFAPPIFSPAGFASSPGGRALLGRAVVVSNLVRAAARHGFTRPACLVQSLALCWLLRRRGWPAELHLGARKTGDGLEAHAWVELDGVALEEQSRLDFAAFERVSPSPQPHFGAPSR